MLYRTNLVCRLNLVYFVQSLHHAIVDKKKMATSYVFPSCCDLNPVVTHWGELE